MCGGGGDEEESMGLGGGGLGMMRMRPTTSGPSAGGQWAQDETRELIAIRGELERDSNVGKRSKALWEAVSSAMTLRGFNRTPEQCKCKWKNLLIRYKGRETSDPESGPQCPFFEELQAVFTERAKNMERLLVESQLGSAPSTKRVKKSRAGQSSDDISDSNANHNRKKVKAETERLVMPRVTNAASCSSGTSVQEMLREFLQQQQRMEIEWRDMMERRAQERQLFEQEWRHKMEKMERERLVVEQAWREKEEERRIREDSRAERMDALLTTLFNKLTNQTNF